MADEAKPTDLMHYDAMAQDALRGVVKLALKRAAAPGGLPGAHHLYITFKSEAAGVSGPPDLLDRYPDEMTIVLQHQYWDLAPGETFFTVTLKFGGEQKKLSVPYSAITRFYDPSVQYLLQFEPPPTAQVQAIKPAEVPKSPKPSKIKAEPAAKTDEGDDEPKVVSLDQFRKK